MSTETERWDALKDYLTSTIEQDVAVHRSFLDAGDMATAAPFGGLVSANRSTLAKMRELEGRPTPDAREALTGNCPACWHLWDLHGPDGCTAKVGNTLDGLVPCPCEHLKEAGQ